MCAHHPEPSLTLINRWSVQIEKADEDLDGAALFQILKQCRAALGGLRSQTPIMGPKLHVVIGDAFLALAHINYDAEYCDKAWQQYRRAEKHLPSGQSEQITARLDEKIGYCLQLKGQLLDDQHVLHQAIDYFDKACKGQSGGSREKSAEGRALCLGHLGQLNGDVKPVIKAVRILRSIVRMQSKRGKASAKTLCNLIAVLYANAKLTRSVRLYTQLHGTLKNNIAAIQGRSTAASKRQSLAYLHYYIRVCGELGVLTGDPLLIFEAIRTGESTEAMAPQSGYPLQWADNRHLLGNALAALAAQKRDAGQYIQAVNILESARRVYSCHGLRNSWGRVSFDIGLLKQQLFQFIKGRPRAYDYEEEFERSLRIFSPTLSPELTAKALMILARDRFRRKEWKKALATFSRAEAVLAVLKKDPALDQTSRQKLVGAFGEFYHMAAFCYLIQKKFRSALRTIDRGHAILLSGDRALQNSEFECLSDEEQSILDEAKARFMRMRQKLYAIHNRPSLIKSDVQPLITKIRPVDDIDRLIEKMEQAWTAYCACRTQYGLDDFETKRDFEGDVLKLPTGTVLIFFIFTDLGCAALIGIANGQREPPVHLVRFRSGLFDRLGNILERPLGDQDGTGWFHAYNRLSRRIETDDILDRLKEDGASWGEWHPTYLAWNKGLDSTLQKLWTELMEPVHRKLQDLKIPQDNQVVLFPPGTLSNLPLHAAGYQKNDHWCCFLDSWIVSYAPNLFSLARACRKKTAKNRQAPSIAILAPDSEENADEMPDFVSAEADHLYKSYGGHDVRMIRPENASLGKLTDALSNATYFHVSTHGVHSWTNPETSGMEIWPGFVFPLKLIETSNLRLANCRAIFLSTCASGLTDIYRAPSEHIGLSTGFLTAGASCVVSTLWPIFEDAGFLLAIKFYECLLGRNLQEKMTPAEALRAAQLWLRDVTFHDLAREFGTLTYQGKIWIAMPTGKKQFAVRPMILKGPDSQKPFSMPHEWAAHLATGI